MQDLEMELEGAVNRFIATATKLLSQPLLQFLVQVETLKQQPGSGTLCLCAQCTVVKHSGCVPWLRTIVLTTT